MNSDTFFPFSIMWWWSASEAPHSRQNSSTTPQDIYTKVAQASDIYLFRRAVRENGARNVVGNEHEQRVGTDHFLHACRKLVLLTFRVT